MRSDSTKIININEGDKINEVEGLRDLRQRKTRWGILIKWKDFGEDEETWETRGKPKSCSKRPVP